MKIRIYKGTPRGSVIAPPSKSIAHRLLIAAAMCEGVSTVRRVPDCEDVLATLDCLNALGVKTERCGEDIRIWGIDFKTARAISPLPCRESGSTMRFMIPIALLSGNEATLTGKAGLLTRPMTPYERIARECGLTFTKNQDGYTVCGPLMAGEYSLPGDVSSQFITGLIFALAALGEDSKIRITTPLESRSYIELTREALSLFGISVVWEDELTLHIPGTKRPRAREVTVEGDFSGAAFMLALNHLGGEVEIGGLNPESIQGDRVCTELFDRLHSAGEVIDITDCPDLAPILFALAAALSGATFTGTRRLKIKESDRATAMAEELSRLGIEVTVEENTVTVKKSALREPNAPISAHNDHRIVMALATLLTLTGGVIDGTEAVKKSYPDFFRHLGIDRKSVV